jgi:hypothetical protein
VALDAPTKGLMNLCFGEACEDQYAELGLAGLRKHVRRALDEVFEGRRGTMGAVSDPGDLTEDLLTAVKLRFWR